MFDTGRMLTTTSYKSWPQAATASAVVSWPLTKTSFVVVAITLKKKHQLTSNCSFSGPTWFYWVHHRQLSSVKIWSSVVTPCSRLEPVGAERKNKHDQFEIPMTEWHSDLLTETTMLSKTCTVSGACACVARVRPSAHKMISLNPRRSATSKREKKKWRKKYYREEQSLNVAAQLQLEIFGFFSRPCHFLSVFVSFLYTAAAFSRLWLCKCHRIMFWICNSVATTFLLLLFSLSLLWCGHNNIFNFHVEIITIDTKFIWHLA